MLWGSVLGLRRRLWEWLGGGRLREKEKGEEDRGRAKAWTWSTLEYLMMTRHRRGQFVNGE